MSHPPLQLPQRVLDAVLAQVHDKELEPFQPHVIEDFCYLKVHILNCWISPQFLSLEPIPLSLLALTELSVSLIVL